MADDNMTGKRKWHQGDWEVVMAAQSYVAVLAAPPSDEEEAAAPVPANKKAVEKRAKTKSTKKTKAKTRAAPTKRSSRRTAADTKPSATPKDPDVDMEGGESKEEEGKDAVQEFWLAELQDDVTEDMLDQPDVSVHVTWLDKMAGTENRYKLAYDEHVDVGTILCHVYLRELTETTLELTPKSLARVQRSLARSKARLAGVLPEDEETVESDNERPPTSSRGPKRLAEGEEHPSRGVSGRKTVKTKKLSKREAEMHIPPHRASVDEEKYQDVEMLGSHDFSLFSGDAVSANREVVRAVLTNNVKLLETLTTKKELYVELSAFDAPRSADVKHSAMQYAIDKNDLKAVGLLRQAKEKVDDELLTSPPDVALPSHSTGKHTSRFSDYNRRAINASRGGKEGNNALLEDISALHGLSELNYIWQSPGASIEMLTLVYPTGEWTNGYALGSKVCNAARCGNFRLVRKVVETLARNGGWGFNELHYKVLADGPQGDGGGTLLPPFRAVSAIKQANMTRLRPIHLAAINPNTKFLAALWVVAGDEYSAVKDIQGYEPVHYAACCESPEPLQFLMERRCSLFARTKSKLTPLMCALEAKRESTALALLKFAATPGENGGGGQEVADKLVRERGPGNKQAMHFAAMHGCSEVLEYLLTNCPDAADANAVSGGATKDTPLVLAAKHGHLECIRVLLAHGARVDLGDKLKKTPLIFAVKNGHTRVAAVLINGGANVNAFDTSENSAVHYAASYGWPSSLQLLCDAGAELWAQNTWGFVPLACALLKQRRACAEMLLAQVSGEEQRKFLDFRDRQGRTMLFLQCQHSHSVGQLNYLLQKGLNPNIGDSNGEFPLQMLIRRICSQSRMNRNEADKDRDRFYVEAIRLLLKHGAIPQYELPQEVPGKLTPNVVQPLQEAMAGNQLEIFEVLLAQPSVQSDATSSDGSDAWLTAASMGAGHGDKFLSKLLEHHTKTTDGEPLQLSARLRTSRQNFFHIVAAHAVNKLTAVPKLIRECAKRCPSTAEMLREKDSGGCTPVMQLLACGQERNMLAQKDMADADKLQLMKDVDDRFTQLLTFYAEKTTTRGAFISTVSGTQLRCITGVKKNDNGGITTCQVGAGGGDQSDGEDEDFVPKEGSDDSDSSTSSKDEAESSEKEDPKTAESKQEDDANEEDKVFVEYDTALHRIAKRVLTCEPDEPEKKWYSANLMQLLFDKRPELFHDDPEDADKSLVAVVDLEKFKTPLHYAVETGDVPTVRLLLAHGAEPNVSHVRCSNCKAFVINDVIAQATERAIGTISTSTQREKDCLGGCGMKELVEPPLFEAVRRKRTRSARLLLKHGAEVQCVSRTLKETPLHVALQTNDAAAVSFLLAHGASLLAQNSAGASPLYQAVERKNSVPAKEVHAGEVAYASLTITKPSATISETFGGSQASAVDTGAFELQPAKGSEQEDAHPQGETEWAILVALKDPKAQHAVTLGNEKNQSPVHLAALFRDLELLRALLRAAGPSGAREAVNKRDVQGRTPLHYALNAARMNANASFAVERLLLQNGADADLQDAFDFSALHFALFKVDLDWQTAYDTKNKSKSEKEQQSRKSYEADKRAAFLHKVLAVIPTNEADPVETVSNLASERELNLLAKDVLGRTPLHLAAATGAFVCVSTLLSAMGTTQKQDESMAIQDKDEFTPLGLAVLHLRQTTIMTLLQGRSAVDGTLRIKAKGSSRADENAADKTKKPPKVKTRSYFYHAVSHSLTGICHMLLSAKFCRRQAIEDAVRCGEFQLATNLISVLEGGAEGGLLLLSRVNSLGETLLHSLAKVKRSEFDPLARRLAWTLVDAGVRAGERDNKGNLALHYAAKRGNLNLVDFLQHQRRGVGDENAVNADGETALLFALNQKPRGDGLSDDELLVVLRYFIQHPIFPVHLHPTDNSGKNVLGAFLDRFTESLASTQLASAQPAVFFTWLEMLLQRGADPNIVFQSLHTAKFQRKKSPDDADEETLLRFGMEPCEVTESTEKMPALVRVALTPDPATRFHGLALLLRYGAKLSTPDGRGNTLLMHLATQNLLPEMKLSLGLVRAVPDPKSVFATDLTSFGEATRSSSTRMCSLHVPEPSIKAALAQRNPAGQTVCHMAVQPLEYGSYENTRLLAMLVRAGASLQIKDNTGKSPVDYARAQRSRKVLDFLQREFPQLVPSQLESKDPPTMFQPAPKYSDDASAYLEECESSGKIKRTRMEPKVNASCDVGSVSKVHSEGAQEGAELDALLTKVDVKNGRFGLNVFYRLQLVQDKLQDIFVLFTNWGRIGETGKFQNTPFRDEAEAVNEFKKIFRSKTGNAWEARAPEEFVKKPKKYNLVQRINYNTKVDAEVTRSFREELAMREKPMSTVFPEPHDADLIGKPSVLAMLAAITDVRNLRLAAQQSCGFSGGDLPLAKHEELRAAKDKLFEIRGLLQEKVELVKDIGAATGDLSDEGTTRRALLATRHEALIERVSEYSSRYYEVMPCTEGNDALASSIQAFEDVDDVNKEITRLRMLADIMETYKMLLGAKRQLALREENPLEYCYHALQVRLAPLEPANPERQLIRRYFFGGLRPRQRNSYRVSNVFEVERQGESQRFDELMTARPDLQVKRSSLLWHGTKRTNLMGILSQGLRVAPPEAPHHGYAYGKGLYFADIAEKSLNYCDSPYALPSMSDKTLKTREVHYMMLCEVALGQPTEVGADAAWDSKSLPEEGMDSVKVQAKHIPEPRSALVSPKCGAKLPVGPVKRLGENIPYTRVWALSKLEPRQYGYFNRSPKFTADTQAYLCKLVADKSFGVGDTHTVSTEGNDRALFVKYSHRSRSITIELVSRSTPMESQHDSNNDTGEDASDSAETTGTWCEATLKVNNRAVQGSDNYSYVAKLYRNAFTSTPMPDGFELEEPSLSAYAELVVYNEAQARLRYVVEVETVRD